MKINIGIVGYGNLGKSVEQIILANNRFNLVAIFSRRVVSSKFNTIIEPYDSFVKYKDKIDIMILCGGSKSDLEIQTPEILSFFDCINTFDNHNKILSEYKKLDSLAKITKHRLIMSCGWDPGIFSMIRALFQAISLNDKSNPVTFWGKGISLGHSEAIRKINGVVDAIQFTIPNKLALSNAKKGIIDKNTPLHFRECFVVTNEQDKSKIENDILNIPNYFKGQPTKINFVSSIKLSKLKNKLNHKGEIFYSFKTIHNSNCKMKFAVSMESNPNFTANIVVSYLNAIINLKENKICGAFTNLDIPISYLFLGKDKENLLKKLC